MAAASSDAEMIEVETGHEPPAVLSVNVGTPRTVRWRGRAVTTAIWKEPVEGPVVVEGVNLAGDDQDDRRVHGGPDRAVYAYAAEDYAWWAASLGALAPGTFGENLTTVGIDLGQSRIGDRWRVGSVELEVAQPRTPCFKLGIRMGDDDFPRRFAEAGRPGVLLRIVSPGPVRAGDTIDVSAAAEPAVRIGSLVAADVAADVLRLVSGDARVPEGWRRWAARELAS